MEIAGRKALVIGAARSGIASARFLAQRGATVALNDRKPLSKWKPEISQKVRALVSQVRALVAKIIELADDDTLDVMRSRAVEQEVLDLLDEPASR